MLMGWVKMITSFLCQINQPTRERISIMCNIGKLNDLCIINFTCYNLLKYNARKVLH